MTMARRGSREEEMISDRRGERRADHGQVAAGMIGLPDETTGMEAFERNHHEMHLVRLEVIDWIHRRPGHQPRRVSKRSSRSSERRRRPRNSLAKLPFLMRRARLDGRYSMICNWARDQPLARVSRFAHARVWNAHSCFCQTSQKQAIWTSFRRPRSYHSP